MLTEHPVRRQVYLIHRDGDCKGNLCAGMTETFDAIDALRAEGPNVVVYCHGGRCPMPLTFSGVEDASRCHRSRCCASLAGCGVAAFVGSQTQLKVVPRAAVGYGRVSKALLSLSTVLLVRLSRVFLPHDEAHKELSVEWH